MKTQNSNIAQSSIYLSKSKKQKSSFKETMRYISQNYDLYLFILPVMAYIIIFHYVPMYGVQIAFKNFIATKGIAGSQWVGFKHFERFFSSSYFWPIIKNTLGISFYSLILALLLNQLTNKRYRKIIQTVTYAPHFISTVVIVGMLMVFLSPRTGMINHVIRFLGGEPVFFIARPEWFKTVYVFSGLWQSTGWNAIIYLAALSNISPELHEAAIVDGASKLQRIWYIDIPGIIPTAVILLIMNLGSIMSVGFEKAYLMQNNLNASSSEIIATYVYKTGLLGAQFSFSAAVGLFNSIINFILLAFVNKIARKMSDISLW